MLPIVVIVALLCLFLTPIEPSLLVFVLAALADPNYLCIAFDAGGVTTGPMTVPFILALGVGVANMWMKRSFFSKIRNQPRGHSSST